jgi:hypothetical protein
VHRLACKEGVIEPVQNLVDFILKFLRISQGFNGELIFLF